ncbi:MAG: DHH family phosphoesterase [Chloroflexia bacterium]
MEAAPITTETIAAALERIYGFPPHKAVALARAGPEAIRSPWSIPGMEALVTRLVEAVRRRQPILVFGDFDTDGVTGTAILFRTLARHGAPVRRYNPFYHEDYGLHVEQVERFARTGIRLIVTVDTGITSLEAIARARQLGIDVLVTDHHLPLENPGPPDTPWVDPPDHLLSGAQIAYLVARAVEERLGKPPVHDPWGLCLAAVGAQMDWVPVDEPETRAWVAWGHRILLSPDGPRGLHVTRQLLGERYTPSEMLSLGGVLNMAKRSHRVNPNEITEALLPETSEERCREIIRFLLEERARAQRVASAVTARAIEDLRGEVGRPGLLIYEVEVPDETLSEIEGPLTSRLAEFTGRPTLVLRPAGERINFSGRARGDFSFDSLLNDPEVRALTLGMGGHRQAIGGSIRAEDRAAFLEAVRRWESRLPPWQPGAEPEPISLERLDPAIAYLYGRAIGPFGHRLRPPHFRTLLEAKGGWAFSGDTLVELDRPLPEGAWEVLFRFSEAGCDGKNVVLHVEEARRA